jgi:hypothetical protein
MVQSDIIEVVSSLIRDGIYKWDLKDEERTAYTLSVRNIRIARILDKKMGLKTFNINRTICIDTENREKLKKYIVGDSNLSLFENEIEVVNSGENNNYWYKVEMVNGKVYIFENQEVAGSFFGVNKSTFIGWVSQKTKGYLIKGIKKVTMSKYTTGKYEKQLLLKRRND